MWRASGDCLDPKTPLKINAGLCPKSRCTLFQRESRISSLTVARRHKTLIGFFFNYFDNWTEGTDRRVLKVLKTHPPVAEVVQWGDLCHRLLTTKITQILPEICQCSCSCKSNEQRWLSWQEQQGFAHPLVLTALSETIHPRERSHVWWG